MSWFKVVVKEEDAHGDVWIIKWFKVEMYKSLQTINPTVFNISLRQQWHFTVKHLNHRVTHTFKESIDAKPTWYHELVKHYSTHTWWYLCLPFSKWHSFPSNCVSPCQRVVDPPLPPVIIPHMGIFSIPLNKWNMSVILFQASFDFQHLPSPFVLWEQSPPPVCEAFLKISCNFKYIWLGHSDQ